MSRKKGELIIVVTILIATVLILVLGVVSIQYFQINNTLTDIKSNLFYICQNAVIAYGDGLAFDVYSVNTNKLKNVVSDLLTKTYVNGRKDITAITTDEVYIVTNESECISHSNGMYKTPFIHIKITVEFSPVLKLEGLAKRKINIHQDVKLSLMVY